MDASLAKLVLITAADPKTTGLWLANWRVFQLLHRLESYIVLPSSRLLPLPDTPPWWNRIRDPGGVTSLIPNVTVETRRVRLWKEVAWSDLFHHSALREKTGDECGEFGDWITQLGTWVRQESRFKCHASYS